MNLYPPFARPVSAPPRRVVPEGAADPRADDDLPAIEQFLDELPSIEDYLEDETGYETLGMPTAMGIPDGDISEYDDEGWAISEWQSYDWSGLAALGHSSADRSPADERWNANAWEAGDPFGDEDPRGEVLLSGRNTSADEVASALVGIARRIRSGELSIDQFRGTPPEAALAAALAALLQRRG